MGAIVGAGIYVVSGLAVELAGPTILISVILAGVVATGNALSSAQLAAAFPVSGGTYEYGYRLFGPWTGYTAGWMFLVAKLTALATVALGFGAYLQWLTPTLDARWGAAAAVVGSTLLVRSGIRSSSRANLLLVTLSVGALILFVLWVWPTAGPDRPPLITEVNTLTLRAAALMFFAYTGFARIATLGEEVVDPRHTIPRAVVITLVLAGVLYVAVSLALVSAASGTALSARGAPLLSVAEARGQPLLALMVVAGASAAMLGVILNQILGLSRMALAMARRGDLPTALSRIDARYRGPTVATYAVGVVGVGLALTGIWSTLVSVSAFSILVYYAIANLAALRLDRGRRLYPRIVSWTGLLGCASFAVSLAPTTLAIGIVTLAVGVSLRAIIPRRSVQ